MTDKKPKKKPEPKPTPPVAIDKSEMLARVEESINTAHAAFVLAHPEMTADEAGRAFMLADVPIALAPNTKPMRIGSADAVIHCPTCGTAKTGNRCEVCGHQEVDT